jgi:hypothetical protein
MTHDKITEIFWTSYFFILSLTLVFCIPIGKGKN